MRPQFKVIAIFLLLFVAAGVFAQTQGTFESGVTWAFSNDGTLRISGTGPMPRSYPAAVPPWSSVRNRITSVIIEDGITSLPVAGFAGSPLLTSITIGRGVTALPESVFSRTGITSITIPPQIASIEISAFDVVNNLETVYFNAVNCADFAPMLSHPPFHSTRAPALKTVVIGNTVRRIPNSIFNGSITITTLTFGSSVTEIGDRSFRGCTGLTSIVIPNSVNTIGPFAFENCTNVTSITLGNEVSVIRQEAFTGTRITEITIPENITTLWTGSFRNSNRLQTVYFNATNVTNTGGNGSPFVDSQSLEKIIFGENVRQIPSQVAFQLTSLESITIGSRVNVIGDRAFYGCIALEEIINNARNPQALRNEMFFHGVNKSFCVVRVPAASVNAYRAANIWKDFQILAQ